MILATNDRLERRAGYLFALIFLVLTVGIALSGFFYYRGYERNFRAQMERQLSAIAELKAGQLTQWRKERIADANVLFKNEAFTTLVRQYLQSPEDANARRPLLAWMTSLQTFYQYDNVRLFDSQGAIALAVSENVSASSPFVFQKISEVLRTGEVILLDFYRSEKDHKAYLKILIPCMDEQEGNKPLGVLALRINPEIYLYPMIKRWPMPSETAETLIVRRDGNDALFLNELRFQKNAELSLRIPLDRTETPAVAALQGYEGVMEGLDYRKVPVIAATCHIPDSPWFMVARMDRTEIYAPMRQRWWQVFVFAVVLFFGALVGMGMLWRQQSLRLYREQYEAAEALHAISAHQGALLAAIPDIIMEVDKNKVYTWANQPGIEFFGEDVLGKEAASYFAKGQDIYKAVQPLFNGDDELIYLESWQRRKDGEERLLAWWCKVLKDSSGNVIGALSSARDITEHKHAEDHLRGVLADLERSNKELEQFAYVASHDLQEPLRMVSSYTQLLATRYEGQLDEKAKKYIDYAVDGAVRMQHLISDLLTYSRVGTQDAKLERIDSHAALELALVNLQSAIEETGAIIINDDLPMVYANASQLAHLFQNLIGNAIKFHGPETPHVHISAKMQGNIVEFCVRDNGIGIDPKYADRVFVIFQRLHTREEYPGTGIGLALCKRIVERHGGKIWFDSEPGKGAYFYFTVFAKKSKEYIA